MQKVAILIDGAFFIKRINKIFPNKIAQTKDKSYDLTNASDFMKLISHICDNHLNFINELYQLPNPRALLHRIYYYDAMPFEKRIHLPISKNTIAFGKTPEAVFRKELFYHLKGFPDFALRLGEVREGDGWVLKRQKQEDIINHLHKGGSFSIKDLSDDDFHFALRQKAVDMRIGVDITTLALKKQVDTIILISGDADFIPASKLARSEGIRFILDAMAQPVSDELREHVDVFMNSFLRISINRSPDKFTRFDTP